MRTFVRNVILFLLPVVVLMAAMEYVQRQLPNEYTYRKTLFEQRLPRIETIILGSSHTYMGVNPALLTDKAFNMAYTAQTLYFDDWVLSRYMDQMPRLKTVIIPVSYPSYGAESNLLPGDYNRSNHFHLFYGASKFVNYTKAPHYSWMALFTVKGSVERTIDYYHRGKPLVEADTNGWYGTDDHRELKKNAKDSGTFHDKFYAEKVIPVNTERVAHMLQLCRAKGVRPLLISTPMYSGYFQHTQPARYDRMVAITDSLASVYDVKYYNFSKDTTYSDGDFFDSNHLNRTGAGKFTAVLDSIIMAGK